MKHSTATQLTPIFSGTFLLTLGAICLLGGCVMRDYRDWHAYALLASLSAALLWVARTIASRSNQQPTDDLQLAINQQERALFKMIQAAQGAGIVFFSILLTIFGRGQWTVPCIGLVISAHLLLLAKVCEARIYLVAGGSLLLWNVAYPFLLLRGPMSALGPLGAGAILWLMAVLGMAIDWRASRNV
jgi:hypothetical protein